MLKKKPVVPKKVKQVAIYEISTSDLIAQVAENSNYTQAAVKDIITAFMETARENIAEGHTVTLYRIGTFSTGIRAERNGRNPKTGESIVIPAMRSLRFKISAGIKAKVKSSAV